MNKIVLTGPTGAIGIAMIQQCIQEGIEVYAICRRNSERIRNIPQNSLVHILECNLDEIKSFKKIGCSSCDVFYHLGWNATIGDGRNDMDLQLQNIQYTLDAVRLAKRLGCKVFVGAGSQAEYGRYEGKLDAKVPVFPENGYGIAKLCAGQMSRLECYKMEMDHVWARILSVYGPYDGDKTMLISLIEKLLRGERPALTGGEQRWDYLYSADAAKALILLGERGINGKTYCIGSGNAMPLFDYIHMTCDAIAPEAELGIGEIPYGEKQVMNLCADISELTKDTGFFPEISFEDGIRKTIAWVKTRK